MKNKFMRASVKTFLGLLLLFGGMQSSVSAQGSEQNKLRLFDEGYGPGIEGVWRTTITQLNCQTGVVIRISKGLVTFAVGGTIAETSNALPPAFRSPGHGLWEKQSSRTYSGAFVFQIFNPDGSFAGIQKINQTYQLSRFGDTYTSTGTIQISDPNDNIIANGCATATATRFELK